MWTQDKKKWERRRLTLKQDRFIDEYTKTGNATEAADRVYKTKNRRTSMAIWNENLWKPMIQAEIQTRLKKCKDEMYRLALFAEKDSDRIKALQDTIDRIEGKPIARTEISGKDWWPIQLEDLSNKSLKELDEIRKKLLNQYKK